MTRHHHKRTAAPGEWASRNRSYVVTVGLIWATLAIVLWKLQGSDAPQWPVWKWVLLYLTSGLGLAFLITGLLASQGFIKKVAAGTSLSWVTFPVRLLAFPVQLVLSVFDRRR